MTECHPSEKVCFYLQDFEEKVFILLQCFEWLLLTTENLKYSS